MMAFHPHIGRTVLHKEGVSVQAESSHPWPVAGNTAPLCPIAGERKGERKSGMSFVYPKLKHCFLKTS